MENNTDDSMDRKEFLESMERGYFPLKDFDFDEENVRETRTCDCDNPQCQASFLMKDDENYDDWIGRECPDCGEILLTQEDHDKQLLLVTAINGGKIPVEFMVAVSKAIHEKGLEVENLTEEDLEKLSFKVRHGEIVIEM